MRVSRSVSLAASSLQKIAGALCLLLLAPIPAGARPIISKPAGAVGVTVPLMGRDQSKPAASLSAASFGVGSQRRGFFRIGILPLLIASDVRIIFSGEPPDPTALADLAPAFKALANTSAVEIHQFAVLLPGKCQPALQAARAEPAGKGDWKLTEVTLSGPIPMHLPEAILRTGGTEAGQLTFVAAGANQELNLFGRSQQQSQ